MSLSDSSRGRHCHPRNKMLHSISVPDAEPSPTATSVRTNGKNPDHCSGSKPSHFSCEAEKIALPELKSAIERTVGTPSTDRGQCKRWEDSQEVHAANLQNQTCAACLNASHIIKEAIEMKHNGKTAKHLGIDKN